MQPSRHGRVRLQGLSDGKAGEELCHVIGSVTCKLRVTVAKTYSQRRKPHYEADSAGSYRALHSGCCYSLWAQWQHAMPFKLFTNASWNAVSHRLMWLFFFFLKCVYTFLHWWFCFVKAGS